MEFEMPFPRKALLMTSVLILCACGKPQLQTGEELFDHYCATCHRKTGTGNFLKGAPAVQSTQYNTSQIAQLIRGHRRPTDTRMPVFNELTSKQTIAIAAYVRHNLKRY
jgi:mono/diheme cytochrome c family protein